MKARKLLVAGIVVSALFLSGPTVIADSAAQIYQGPGLAYVKHVNNLPEGVTTLWARSTCAPGSTTARITFQAQVDRTHTLTREIYASFRGGEEKKFVINWGKPVTDLNFIRLLAVRSTCGTNGGGGNGGCEVGPGGKVTICHYPPGNPNNPQTISISANALPAHLAHGDSCGPCK